MARHAETAFIPMNVGNGKRIKPWFAIAALNWSARGARANMTERDPRGHKEAWRLLRKAGWRIVKVRVASQ